MDNNIFLQLIYNASLLLALSIIYEVSYQIPIKWKRITPYTNGMLIGLIAVCTMSIPFRLTPGIFFDTRSILIGVAALTFGSIPTIIAGIITIVYRIMIGGSGMLTGISVVVISVAIGLVWRHALLNKKTINRWMNFYLLGIALHIAMLLCMLIMPWATAMEVLKRITLPVLLIYPVATVLLCLLLTGQKDRNEAMNRIIMAEERYKSLFNNNHAIMLIIDSQTGQIVDANPAAATFYGWSVQTLKTMNITQINTLSAEAVKLEMVKSANEDRNHFIFKHQCASGEIVDVEVYSGPIQLDERKLIHSIVHDISLRVAANNALFESEHRFRLVVESAPYAIFIQTNMCFAYVNPAAIRLFGAVSADQLIGMPVMDRFRMDYNQIARERIHQLNDLKQAVPNKELVFLKLDNTAVIVEASGVPIHYTGFDGAMVFTQDITERKKTEAAGVKLEAQLRQQQKLEAIGTLASGVAHEINNPINGIMNYAQLILDGVDKDAAEAEYTREIIHESNRISTIVRSLLQFSRQEKQSHSYASMYDIIHQTISLINTVIKKDQIRLELQLDDGLPNIKCRSQQIQQVLMNLLTNARDALNEKYPDYHEDKLILIKSSQYEDSGRRWIRIAVEDHGNGIPKDIIEKIFEAFFSTKPKDKGTGLGLSISFGIIKDHHGMLNIDTKLGQYTRFILDLPVDNGWELYTQNDL